MVSLALLKTKFFFSFFLTCNLISFPSSTPLASVSYAWYNNNKSTVTQKFKFIFLHDYWYEILWLVYNKNSINGEYMWNDVKELQHWQFEKKAV